MGKFNSLKKYAEFYSVQIILLLNYFALWFLIKCVKNILEAPMGICNSEYFCYEVARHFFVGAWLAILALNAIFLFAFYNLEKVLKRKMDALERCQPTRFQYFCFFVGLFALFINILSAPLLALFADIYDAVVFVFFL